MPDLVAKAVEGLREAGVTLAPGLGEDEFARIEQKFQFAFGSEHRAFLTEVVPIGESWVDWRHASDDDIQARLDWPVDGVIFDVHNNVFWPRSWGPRPTDKDEAERVARDRLSHVPRLVPIYSHRYLPAAPAPVPSPVLSVYQSDVIYYGENIADYVAREFAPTNWPVSMRDIQRLPFWSPLAEGAEDVDL